jgi:hypothetical protein
LRDSKGRFVKRNWKDGKYKTGKRMD